MARTEAPRGAVRVGAPGAPGAPGGPLREADAALADRFRRVLGATRRDPLAEPRDAAVPALAAWPAEAGDAADGPVAPAGPHAGPLAPAPGPLDDDEPAAPRERAACAAPEEDDAAAQPLPPAVPEPASLPPGTPAAAPWSWSRHGYHGGASQQQPAPAGEAQPIDAGSEPPWLRDTADFVGSLCAGVDAGFQTWRMTVPLDARQLPDTQLELSLSPHTLCLRFRAAAPESARLVLRYRQHLLDLLGEVPGLPSHIEIELD